MLTGTASGIGAQQAEFVCVVKSAFSPQVVACGAIGRIEAHEGDALRIVRIRARSAARKNQIWDSSRPRQGHKKRSDEGRPAFDRPERVERLLSEGKSVRDVAEGLGIRKSTAMKVKTVLDKTITESCKL